MKLNCVIEIKKIDHSQKIVIVNKRGEKQHQST